jgi:hypothetical protein
VIGAIFTIVSVLYASLRAGSSSITGPSLTSNEVGKEEDEEAVVEDFDDEKESTTYSFSLFHFVFALVCAYGIVVLLVDVHQCDRC